MGRFSNNYGWLFELVNFRTSVSKASGFSLTNEFWNAFFIQSGRRRVGLSVTEGDLKFLHVIVVVFFWYKTFLFKFFSVYVRDKKKPKRRLLQKMGYFSSHSVSVWGGAITCACVITSSSCIPADEITFTPGVKNKPKQPLGLLLPNLWVKFSFTNFVLYI
jgi:hypothetical protein